MQTLKQTPFAAREIHCQNRAELEFARKPLLKSRPFLLQLFTSGGILATSRHVPSEIPLRGGRGTTRGRASGAEETQRGRHIHRGSE